jgi:hypothetical protein
LSRPPLRASLVLDEAVAVAIAPLVDPAERGPSRWAEAVHELPVAGPVERLAEEDQPERRRVDAAVVRRVGQLPGPGRLADPQLVEDLARLGVAPLVDLGRLEEARTSSVSTAIWGRNGSVWIAVMIESRPNKVVNHGTPAAM